MTVPYTLQDAGYTRTLQQIRHALEQRITNATNRLPHTPVYHRGTPDPNALPDEPLGVWLDWSHVGPDEDETNAATFLASTWNINIVARSEAQDAFGSQSDLAEQVWGAIVKTLTETNTDLGLDGSADIVVVPEANHFQGVISGGDRRIEHIELQAIVRHEMELVRCP